MYAPQRAVVRDLLATVRNFFRTGTTLVLAPPPESPRAWSRTQRALAALLLEKGRDVFPDAPAPDLDPLRWPAKEQPGDEVPNCTPYAYCLPVGQGYNMVDPGNIAQRFRQDAAAEKLQSAHSRVSPDGLRALVECDGLTPLTLQDLEVAHPHCHAVAVWVLPGKGYHLARIDATGGWSEKPGTYPVQRRRISGPDSLLRFTGDRRSFHFLGFYLFDPERVFALAPLLRTPVIQRALDMLM